MIQRLSCAALIVLPILVARVDAAPNKAAAPKAASASQKANTAAPTPSPKASVAAVETEAAPESRGAIYNLSMGRSVRLTLAKAATFRILSGSDVVRVVREDGVLSVEPLRAGQASLVIEREGRTPQSYLIRVRDENSGETTAPKAGNDVRPVSVDPAVVVARSAQTANLTGSTEGAATGTTTSGTSTGETVTATTPVPVTVESTTTDGGSSVTVTPATTTLTGPTDIVVSTNQVTQPGTATTGDTRTITSTPPRGALTTTSTPIYPEAPATAGDGTRLSRPLLAPSRLPSGRAPFPTQSNVPARVQSAIGRAPRNSIAVTQGLARLLQFRKNILSVFFSDVNVMDARAVNARTVAITGLAPGTSTLAVFSERFPGDAVGQPNIYQITVRSVTGQAAPVTPTPNVEAIEEAIRTAIDDPRVAVSVIQSPSGALAARLTGVVRDVAEIEALKATAGLFVPTVVSALYADKETLTLGQARLPGAASQLQDTLRRVTENQSIELIDAPGGGSILKASVGSMEEADALMRLIPLQQRVTPFIVVRGSGGANVAPAIYSQVRPTLTGEDAEMTERLQAVTNVRSVYVTRTAQNGLAVYGTVRNRTEYDMVRRYARILPQVKNGVGEREDNIEANFPAGAGTFPLGVQMFVRILDDSQAVLRKVTVQTNVVEINRNALKNLGIEYGSATLLSESVTADTVTRTIDPTFIPGSTLGGNGFIGTGGFNFFSPFRARLNALYTRGNARLLSSPNLTALNGMSAQITVGGSRPIPKGAAGGGASAFGVDFRRFGIIMTMRPTVTDDDTILLQIRADVSSIDSASGITVGNSFVPGESVRSIDTTINVREGDIIVMGGLMTNERLQRTSKVPFLSQIPILGSLFQSRRFENNETELAIFMMPTITRTPASAETEISAFNGEALTPLPGNLDGGSSVDLIRDNTTVNVGK
jgi:Flp pilus assembly secretin CpaC